jgi:hypothetical protein
VSITAHPVTPQSLLPRRDSSTYHRSGHSSRCQRLKGSSRNARRSECSGALDCDELAINDVPRIGDLKLFEPKTMRPLIAVCDREEREPGPGLAMWIEVDVTCRLHDGRCA